MARRSPCYECTQREAGCHAHCESYAALARRILEHREAAQAISDADGFAVDQHYRRKRECHERRGG